MFNFWGIEHFKSVVRKFLDGQIIETPLIVLQYYKKPSFSIYIYPYMDLYKSTICKFILQI
jgi:hypothetical protein